jgi:hypothetical protein
MILQLDPPIPVTTPKGAARRSEHHATKYAIQDAKKIDSLPDLNAKVKYLECPFTSCEIRHYTTPNSDLQT